MSLSNRADDNSLVGAVDRGGRRSRASGANEVVLSDRQCAGRHRAGRLRGSGKGGWRGCGRGWTTGATGRRWLD